MIKIGTKTYAANDSQAIDSLFLGKKTVSGTYKVRKNETLIYNLAGELFAAITHVGFVSAYLLENGKVRFMYALSERDAKKLGVSDMGYSQLNETGKQLYAEIHLGK